MLSSRLRLGFPSDLFPPYFHAKIFYAFSFYTMRLACPVHIKFLTIKDRVVETVKLSLFLTN
jgi:hypothetical protein